jgi:hypothetical protein
MRHANGSLRRVAIAGAITALVSCPGVAAAAPVPGADALDALRAAVRGRTAVVWAGGRRFDLPRAVIDSAGVRSQDRAVYRAPRVAVVQSADAPGPAVPPNPLPWDSIDSVGVLRRGAGAPAVLLLGTVGGAVLGLTVGAAILANATHSSARTVGLAVAVPGIVAGVLAAAIVLPKDRVRVVWRAPAP